MRIFAAMLLSFVFSVAAAQNKTAVVSGKVVDDNDKPLTGVFVIMLGKNTGIQSSDSGTFSLTVPSLKAFALVFTHSGYRSVQKNFYVSAGETEFVIIRLLKTD